ncbi:MAG: chemotaxis protein CheW [Halanaerobium sp.]|nr:chemotaxis protein CheW [Halanaerobium sp.]
MGERTANQANKYVVFNLAGESYGVDILQVREIMDKATITKIPQTPEFVEGIINIRGEIVPVVDLRKRFKVKSEVDYSRIITVFVADTLLGLVVDAVEEVLSISQDCISAINKGQKSMINTRFIENVALMENEMILILNLNRLLSKEEFEQLVEDMEEME